MHVSLVLLIIGVVTFAWSMDNDSKVNSNSWFKKAKALNRKPKLEPIFQQQPKPKPQTQRQTYNHRHEEGHLFFSFPDSASDLPSPQSPQETTFENDDDDEYKKKIVPFNSITTSFNSKTTSFNSKTTSFNSKTTSFNSKKTPILPAGPLSPISPTISEGLIVNPLNNPLESPLKSPLNNLNAWKFPLIVATRVQDPPIGDYSMAKGSWQTPLLLLRDNQFFKGLEGRQRRQGREARQNHLDYGKKSMDEINNPNGNIIRQEDFSSPLISLDEEIKWASLKPLYTLERKLGHGGFGLVRAAICKRLQKRVTIKRIPKGKLMSLAWTTVPGSRMPIEAYILKNCNHPNVIGFVDILEDPESYFLVMEYVRESIDLFTFNEQVSPGNGISLAPTLAKYIFRQVAEAVAYLHHLGLVHGDIKDENILISKIDYSVKLIDFGSSFASSAPLPIFRGTAQYASPEVKSGKAYQGPSCDIYTLGIVLHFLSDYSSRFSNDKDFLGLISGLVEKDHRKRFTIDQVLIHPWLNK